MGHISHTVGAFDAKTHFSQLIAEVSETGAEIVITKHGQKVAALVPYEKISAPDPTVLAINSIRQNRKGVKLGKQLSIGAMIKEGRK